MLCLSYILHDRQTHVCSCLPTHTPLPDNSFARSSPPAHLCVQVIPRLLTEQVDPLPAGSEQGPSVPRADSYCVRVWVVTAHPETSQQACVSPAGFLRKHRRVTCYMARNRVDVKVTGPSHKMCLCCIGESLGDAFTQRRHPLVS